MKDTRATWIVFDVGGVLLDWMSSSDVFAEKLNLTHDELFSALYDLEVEENIGASMNVGKISGQEGWGALLAKFNKQLPFRDIVAAWTAESFWPKDTLQLIRDLKAAGYKMAILSNSWFGLTDSATQDLFPDELQLFDIVIDSAVEKMQKPNPDLYKRFEERVNAHGADIFFIDDDQKNLTVAEELGWESFLYRMGEAGNEVVLNNNKLRELLLS